MKLVINKYIHVFKPDNTYRLFFDFYILAILIINIFNLPLVFSFNLSRINYNKFLYILVNILPPYSFIAEIIINFNTAFYMKGEIITKKKKILLHYLKGAFFMDIISIFPFIVGIVANNEILKYFLLIRIFKLKQLVNKLGDYLELSNYLKGFFDLFKLCFYGIYITHFFLVCGIL